VHHQLADLQPADAQLTLDELRKDLAAIGYPTASA
jgi:hypothetical protein